MADIVNAARMANGAIVARVSPRRYRWANADGSFSNSRPGDRACVHLPEPEARKLIRHERDEHFPFVVAATGHRYQRRVTALGAAVLAQGGW